MIKTSLAWVTQMSDNSDGIEPVRFDLNSDISESAISNWLLLKKKKKVEK